MKIPKIPLAGKIGMVVILLAAAGFGGWQYYQGQQAAKQQAAVETTMVTRRDLKSTVSATGTIRPVNSVEVSSKITARIKEVLVKENDEVKAGQTVAILDGKDYESKRDQAQYKVTNTKAKLDRVSYLYSIGADTQEQYEDELAALYKKEEERKAREAEEAERKRLEAEQAAQQQSYGDETSYDSESSESYSAPVSNSGFMWPVPGQYGITSYIRGSAQQLTWQSYYLVEDTLRHETPKVVVYNVYSLMHDEPQSEAYNRMTLDGMQWSKTKYDAVKASKTKDEDTLDYVFPLLRDAAAKAGQPIRLMLTPWSPPAWTGGLRSVWPIIRRWPTWPPTPNRAARAATRTCAARS